MSNLIVKEYQGFEQIKQVDDSGNEFWSARDFGSDEVPPRSDYPSRFYLRINTIKTK